MQSRPDVPPRTWRRAKWAWKLIQADQAEAKGRFEEAIERLDEAAQIKSLWVPERIQRAMLLVKSERTQEAHKAFAKLRAEPKGSEKPDEQYLRHFCTYMLSGLIRSSGQCGYEAKRGQLIGCSRAIRRRFPMMTIDEIHERIPPKP